MVSVHQPFLNQEERFENCMNYISTGNMNATTYEYCEVLFCFAQSEEAISQDELWLFDIVFWSLSAVSLLLALLMGANIVHYEWFGGDPQKRSLANRFMSNVCICDMTSLIFMVALVINIRC